MIAIVDFYGSTTTGTACNENCRDCTMTCTISVIYVEGRRTASLRTCNEPLYLPEPTGRDIRWEPFDNETLRLWRRESRKKSRYRNPSEHKPLIKRRIPISISGWLARKGRLRKKGKK
jgi:hypothetical protein